MLGRVSCFLSNSVTLPWIVCSMGAIVLGSATGVHLKTLRHVGLAYRMPRVPHCPPPLLLLHYSTRMIYVFVKLRRFLGDSQQPPAAASHGESRFYGFSQSTRLYIHSSQSACVREGRGTHFVVRGAAPGALCASSIWVCPSSTNSSAENISLRL